MCWTLGSLTAWAGGKEALGTGSGFHSGFEGMGFGTGRGVLGGLGCRVWGRKASGEPCTAVVFASGDWVVPTDAGLCASRAGMLESTIRFAAVVSVCCGAGVGGLAIPGDTSRLAGRVAD